MNSTNMAEKIKKLRSERHMTLEEVAAIVGVGKSTVRKWETGMIANMRRDKIASLAKALGTTPAYLMGWEEKEETPVGVRIPVLGHVAAGIPIEAIEDIIDYEEIPQAMAKNGEYFGLRIRGNSMEPRILEGDVVIVRKQPDVESGEIAVVLVNGDEATCKRVVKSDAGITLIALNVAAYPPHFYTAQEVASLPVTIVGKVVELRGKV